jgi:CubicO group peptidase (beta-lactamase class C family)
VKQDDGSYDAQGIFGQTIHIDPKQDLVIVTSSAWPSADDDKYWKNGSAYFAAVTNALRGQ